MYALIYHSSFTYSRYLPGFMSSHISPCLYSKPYFQLTLVILHFMVTDVWGEFSSTIHYHYLDYWIPVVLFPSRGSLPNSVVLYFTVTDVRVLFPSTGMTPEGLTKDIAWHNFLLGAHVSRQDPTHEDLCTYEVTKHLQKHTWLLLCSDQ